MLEIIIIVYWSATFLLLFGREFYVQHTILNTKKIEIQSERTISNLLSEIEVKRRDSFIPPKLTDKPVFG